MDNFSFDAPDYFLDFSKDVSCEAIKKAEAFFEIEHKSHFDVQANPIVNNDESVIDLEQDFFTPMKEPPAKLENAEKYLRNRLQTITLEESANAETHNPLRKSVSMTHLPTGNAVAEKSSDGVSIISDAMENLQVSPKKNKSTNPSRKSHRMTTRADAPKLNLRTRSISRDHLEKLALPKRKNVSHEDLQAKKYVSMAEAINQFQQKTPKRFHSKSKINFAAATNIGRPIVNTIPQSPALATKQRARPTHILSTEERELQEYEEAKKYKIKANPVNPKILSGPVPLKPLTMFKKPTKVEPFNLTQVPTKKADTSLELPLFEFHAKPVPKSVLGPPKPIIKSALHTNPHTPKLMKRYARCETATNETMSGHGQSKIGQPFKGVPTELKPFSFEQRDKEVVKKREQLLNEVLEKEKKAREFHAQPLPKSLFRSPQSKNSTMCYQKRQKSDGSLFQYKSAENMSETLNSVSSFKARPAKVLQMKPFEPVKQEHHIEMAEFQLSTEQRAKQREEYEQKKRDKEEMIAHCIKEREERALRVEQEEVARLRKEAKHKAQPIRRYREVQPVAAKKLTAPKSPNFTFNKIKKDNLIVNKENSMNNSNTNEL